MTYFRFLKLTIVTLISGILSFEPRPSARPDSATDLRGLAEAPLSANVTEVIDKKIQSLLVFDLEGWLPLFSVLGRFLGQESLDLVKSTDFQDFVDVFLM